MREFFIYRLDHVQLAMPPGMEDSARDFYSGILGLKEIPKPANLAKRGGAWFAGGSLRLHLGVEQDFQPAEKAHPALQVRDLQALTRRLQESGIAVVTDEPLEGCARIYVSDPFGNRLELLEPNASLGEISVTAEDAAGQDAARLVAAMCEELRMRYGAEPSVFEPHQAMPPFGGFVIARVSGTAVGCGAFRRLNESAVEIKRMFVTPQFRGRGLARQILSRLEEMAKAQGYRISRLETGVRQPEAVGLYESAGYRPISAYGENVPHPQSLFFEKVIP